jgi:hypothetical protein
MELVVTSASGTVEPELRHALRAIDQSLRQSFAGLDHATVVEEVRRSFAQVDATIGDDDVAAYATAIRDRADFVLSLD